MGTVQRPQQGGGYPLHPNSPGSLAWKVAAGQSPEDQAE